MMIRTDRLAYTTFTDFLSFIFVRQALQLHANVHLKDRKLPKLRTFAEKYLRVLPDLARQDGLGWNYGRSIGAYGQLHCISMILQAMRDNWINTEKMPLYLDTLRRLFQYFFVTYVDQEKGDLMIRDAEREHGREPHDPHGEFRRRPLPLPMVAAGSCDRWLLAVPPPNRAKTAGRFVIFDKSHKKEHGLFLFRDENIGVQYQLPLIGPGKNLSSDNLAFPHCSGIFDWPGQQIPSGHASRTYFRRPSNCSFLLWKKLRNGNRLEKVLLSPLRSARLSQDGRIFRIRIGQLPSSMVLWRRERFSPNLFSRSRIRFRWTK